MEDSSGVNQDLLVKTRHEKEQDVAGKGGHTDHHKPEFFLDKGLCSGS